MVLLKNILYFILLTSTVVTCTQVNSCSKGQKFPLDVRVNGCEMPPCDVIKGEDMIFEIQFAVYKLTTNLTTTVMAKALGLSVPYTLPANVSDVCSNLKYEAYCPLYATEDVTYLFVFPIGNYPEISVKVEIALVDQENEVAACFSCSIKVKKGPSGNTYYQLDF